MQFNAINLGRIDYKEALDYQEKIHQLRLENKIEDTLILQEHYPVLTLGVRGKENNILVSKEYLKEKGINIYSIKRGGDITYHGLGQLVGYVIFDLKKYGRNIKDFVWKIEESLIRFLKDKYNIESYRGEKKYTGVWVRKDKIMAIGIYVNHWVTMHGFSININNDLDEFKIISPCGITDRGVVSLEKLLGKKIDFQKTADLFLKYFCNTFNLKSKVINSLNFELKNFNIILPQRSQRNAEFINFERKLIENASLLCALSVLCGLYHIK